MNITVGIPAYNEEKNIASIIVKLKKIVDTIIVCNDGSNDSASRSNADKSKKKTTIFGTKESGENSIAGQRTIRNTKLHSSKLTHENNKP